MNYLFNEGEKGRARRRSSEEENGRGGLGWGKSERTEYSHLERERIEQENKRGWTREEHPSRVQLRNGFGFVAAFWIKVREETIAVRSSFNFLLLSLTFTLFLSFNYTRGCKRRNRRGDLVSLDVSCLCKVCQLLLHWSWLFRKKKLGMTSFLRFRDRTESECVCVCVRVSECVGVREREREDRL